MCDGGAHSRVCVCVLTAESVCVCSQQSVCAWSITHLLLPSMIERRMLIPVREATVSSRRTRKPRCLLVLQV